MEDEQEENVKDELNRINSGLEVKKIHTPPEGYFDSLPDKVLNRWSNEKSDSPTKKLTWKQVIGIAAVMTGISIGGWLIFNAPKDQVLAPITATEAYQYVHEHIEEFENLIEPQAAYILEQTEIPKEDIEDYLIEELQDTDPEELF